MLTRTGTDTALPLAAVDVAAVAARHADQAEEQRRLAAPVLRAVVAAGFARHFVPAENGGSAGTFAELAAGLTTVGATCPATAWCASVMANLARMAAFLPAEGRKEIWRTGPDAVVVGSVSPKGRAGRDGDGWRLSGAWPYVSAVDFSDWALVLGTAKSEGESPQTLMFAVPRDRYRIEPTWSDIGMCATGSNTLVVEDVHVPDRLSFPAAALFDGRAPGLDAACHRVSLPVTNGLSFCLPMLGAAEGALANWSGHARERIRASERPGPGPGRGYYEETLARSSGEIDAARLLLERAVAVADRGADVTPVETSRNQRDCALVADLLVTAVDRLFRASGTAGHSTRSPLQRLWRDVHSAAGHVVLQLGPNAAAYAGRILDLGT